MSKKKKKKIKAFGKLFVRRKTLYAVFSVSLRSK